MHVVDLLYKMWCFVRISLQKWITVHGFFVKNQISNPWMMKNFIKLQGTNLNVELLINGSLIKDTICGCWKQLLPAAKTKTTKLNLFSDVTKNCSKEVSVKMCFLRNQSFLLTNNKNTIFFIKDETNIEFLQEKTQIKSETVVDWLNFRSLVCVNQFIKKVLFGGFKKKSWKSKRQF